MKQLTCEMCGSTDLVKQDGVFVCQTCGCKYSVEEAKKMIQESSEINIDKTPECEFSNSNNGYSLIIENVMKHKKNVYVSGTIEYGAIEKGDTVCVVKQDGYRIPLTVIDTYKVESQDTREALILEGMDKRYFCRGDRIIKNK